MNNIQYGCINFETKGEPIIYIDKNGKVQIGRYTTLNVSSSVNRGENK